MPSFLLSCVKVVAIDNSEDVGLSCTQVALYLLASESRVASGENVGHSVGLLLRNENVFLCDVFFV